MHPTIAWRGTRTAHQVDPRADAHLLTRLHHLQRLVEQHFARESIIYDLDHAICERKASPSRVLLHADSASEGQLNDYASSKRI